MAIVGLALGVWALWGHNGNAAAIPLLGSIIDASTGKLYPPGEADGPLIAPYGSIEKGNILSFCDPEITNPCTFPTAVSVYARPGDALLFRLRLQDRFNGPIPLVKIIVSWDKSTSFMTAHLAWRVPHSKGSIPENYSDGVQISFTDPAVHNFTYTPGSSVLYAASRENTEDIGKRLARLPDGIMGNAGITLKDVGPPASCFDCTRAYIRVVEFSAHVE